MVTADDIRQELKRVRPLLVVDKCFSGYDWLEERLAILVESLPDKPDEERNAQGGSIEGRVARDSAAQIIRIYAPTAACRHRLARYCAGPDQRAVSKRLKPTVEDAPAKEVVLKQRKRLARHVFVLDAYNLTNVALYNILVNARDGARVTFIGDPYGTCRNDSFLHFEEIPEIEPRPGKHCPKLCHVGLEVSAGWQSPGIKWEVGGLIRNHFKDELLVTDDKAFADKVNATIATWKRGTKDKAAMPLPGDPVWLPYSSTKEGFTLGDTGVVTSKAADGSWRVKLDRSERTVKAKSVEQGWCLPLWVVRHLDLPWQKICLVYPYGKGPKATHIYDICKVGASVSVIVNDEKLLKECCPLGPTHTEEAA